MLGSLSNFAGLMKTAKELQSRLEKLQEELRRHRFEGLAGGGAVRATVDGRGTLLSVKIDPQAVNDLELLEDLIKAAVVSAATKSQEAMRNELAACTGGLPIPGLTELLGGR